jgi:hypothetical protein
MVARQFRRERFLWTDDDPASLEELPRRPSNLLYGFRHVRVTSDTNHILDWGVPMVSNKNRWLCLIGFCLALGIGGLPQSATAQDTPNVLMTIDGMTMLHAGLFRNNAVHDGFNTFQFGPVLFAAGTLGKFKSFYFVKNGTGDGGISHNARMHSDAPEIWTGTAYAPLVQTDLDLDRDVYPLLDRATGGQLFDPTKYQIEVKFKPNIGVSGLPNNTAPLFTVGLDQTDGFVWDAEQSVYKRANDAFTYNIGGAAATPNELNTWYAAAPKDADGYATWTVPVTSPNFVQRGFYYAFGDGPFRTNNVLTGNGKVFNGTTMVWDDVNDGLDTLSFGGGPTGPNPQLKAPNGVPLISFGAPAAETGLSIQVKHISLKKITPESIFARIDSNSGITFRFGSGFTYGTTQPPIVVEGVPATPNATGQISRFDQNNMTNLMLQMRTPDNAGDLHRFVIRGGPSAESFDGSDPNLMMNIRAKLLPGNTAPTLRVVAKDLDGNDTGPGTGADEYTYDIALNQFNTSTFTTISVPFNSFTLSTFTPSPNQTPPNHVNSTGPFGFVNKGDELRTDFNLYEFGGLIPSNTGLLGLELEFMELRLANIVPPGIAGDYNEDDKVDAADYVVWRKNGANPLPNDNGAATAQARFDLWKANFGEMAMPGGGSGAVPEPTSWLLMSLAAALLGLGRRRVRQDCAWN